MAISTFSIGGKQFIEPILEEILIDPWLAQIGLVIGETAQPYSRHEPKRTHIAFDGVIEFRGFSEPIPADRKQHWKTGEPYRTEEIHEAGEAEASGEVERVDRAFFQLVNPPPFRDPQRATVGHKWPVRSSTAPRLVWLSSWGCRIEFLYVGRVSHKDLSDADRLEVWRLQRLRFER